VTPDQEEALPVVTERAFILVSNHINETKEMSEFSRQRVVLNVPGMDAITVERNVRFTSAESGTLSLDLYHPVESEDVVSPAIVFISGYPDPGFEKAVGCKFKELGAYVSWAQLVACSGMVGITYENVNPREDARMVLEFVKQNADSLGVDPFRIGLWACSGNVPVALSLISDPGIDLSCAVLCYGYSLDLNGHTEVADASTQFGFVAAMAGKAVEDVRQVPFLVVRAGQDEMPGLNDSTDRFAASALTNDLPMTLINYPKGTHAFDVSDDSDESRRTVTQILDYLQIHQSIE
jgi:dienelactone hydrolase|tara:strand:+ start:11221 stop:12099 length:879 start_codon:yes stop_codon:yes gene_type:complete